MLIKINKNKLYFKYPHIFYIKEKIFNIIFPYKIYKNNENIFY